MNVSAKAAPKPVSGRWCYKVSIYSRTNIAATLAHVKYVNEVSDYEPPRVKNAYDSDMNYAISTAYFVAYPAAFIRILQFVGKTWNCDVYLHHHDWDQGETTLLDEWHYHHNEGNLD